MVFSPPPSLPRRGGTDTIGYMIVICRYLIISDLSINGVTSISPTGENERGLMTISCSNQSLPLGKVRMCLRPGWV